MRQTGYVDEDMTAFEASSGLYPVVMDPTAPAAGSRMSRLAAPEPQPMEGGLS